MHDAKLVEVQACGNRLEAELVKGALEAAGIPAIIQADSVGGMREHLAWSGQGFKILVREDDAADARSLLDAREDAPGADSETGSDGRPPWRRFT